MRFLKVFLGEVYPSLGWLHSTPYQQSFSVNETKRFAFTFHKFTDLYT